MRLNTVRYNDDDKPRRFAPSRSASRRPVHAPGHFLFTLFTRTRGYPDVRALFRPSGRHLGRAIDHPRPVGIASPARSSPGRGREGSAAAQLTSHHSIGKGILMYSTIQLLAAAGLFVASTVHAQAPERALMSRIPPGHGVAGNPSAAETRQVPPARSLDVAGERALLGLVDDRARPADPAGSTNVPVDGARALLGQWPSVTSIGAGRRLERSSFLADVRGDVTTSASREEPPTTVRAESVSSFGSPLHPERMRRILLVNGSGAAGKTLRSLRSLRMK